MDVRRCIENVDKLNYYYTIGKEYGSNEDFLLFSEINDRDTVMYAIINCVCPEAIELYEDAGLVEDHTLPALEVVTIDGEIPQIVLDALNENGINHWSIIEDVFDCEYGYRDEYLECDQCNNIMMRYLNNSYPEYYSTESSVVCLDCFNQDEEVQDHYIEQLINNPRNANQLIESDVLEKIGFTKLDKVFESGLHEGQNDDPQVIYEELKNQYEEVIFDVENSTMFETEFVVWVRYPVEESEVI